MQIKDLPASSVLNADDVLAKDTNGITTEKITGANLAAAVKLLASLLGVSDVVNSLISTSTTAPLAAAQGKALDEHIGVVQNGLTTIEIDGNSTTHTGGAAQGAFVIVRNSTISSITDGLYTAAQAIPANTAITSAYLTAVDGGGLNAVNKQIESIGELTEEKITTVSIASGTETEVESFQILTPGIYLISIRMDFAAVNGAGARELVTSINNAQSTICATRSSPDTWTVLNGVQILSVVSQTTIKIISYQSSGASMNIGGAYSIIRIR